MRLLTALMAGLILAGAASAQSIPPRDGWIVIATQKAHAGLLADLVAAVTANGMAVVTQAGPTEAARSRGIEIPENRVVGVFNNDFAVRILERSTAAMIEAPIRFYVTGEPDGTATLSYKTPSHVFAPYRDEGGTGLVALAADLDAKFAAIAAEAAR